MVLWAYDIECQDWDTLVVGAAVSDDGRVLIFHEDWECAEWYENLPSTDEVLSHNGGAYDFLQLIAATPYLAWSATIAGSAIVTCRAKGKAQCRDTFRLFPLSLAKWTGEKTETGLPCNCGRECGGYCSIRRDMPRRLLKRLTDYCVNDCRVLLKQFKQDVARLDAEGLSVITKRGIRNTIGGVAWNTAAPWAGLDPSQHIDWGDYDAGRRAYYGGRCEVGRIRAKVGHRYDVHAMYPWALTLDVPFGERRTHLGKTARRWYDKSELGLFHARVRIPDTDVPPLPHRYSGPTIERLVDDRMLWTTGHVEGTWSGIELRHAEERGVKIIEIDEANTWTDRGPIFKPYVEHVYAARRRAIDSCPYGRPDKCNCQGCRWGAVLKWFANALSGRLAMRPEMSRLIVLARGESERKGYKQHGSPKSRVWSQSARRTPSSGMTWAAATLTARARVKLDERLARHSGEWLYCDTDSTYLLHKDKRDVHASKLGTFGYEGQAREWCALAPKLYRYRDENGKEHVRARGVPKADWKSFELLRNGKSVTVDGGVLRIRSSEGKFMRRDLTRSWRDFNTDRCGTRFVQRDGTTRPLHRRADGTYG